MNAFDQYEVWFVTGAQLLYGGDAVIAVDAHSNEMVKGLNESGKLPVKVVMYRCHHLDAHLLACQDVDSRFAAAEEAFASPAYTVQQGNSLGYDGHGLHEPQPERPRRP